MVSRLEKVFFYPRMALNTMSIKGNESGVSQGSEPAKEMLQ